MNAINYRIMDTMDDMQHVEHLQQVVWGMSPAETLGAATIRWMIHIGGLLIGAWHEDQLVGFCVGSPGRREDRWVLWSDMAGIHPDYQSRGIGYQLKIRQKQWALQHGYPEIRWTFDPMRRGNASFNFQKLGVISYLYHPSFYGAMQDNINMGLPADRLEAVWSTSEAYLNPSTSQSSTDFVLWFDGQKIQTSTSDNHQIGIQIPYDLSQLKKDDLPLAVQWQDALRDAFLQSFANNYQAVNFIKDNNHCWYILYKNI